MRSQTGRSTESASEVYLANAKSLSQAVASWSAVWRVTNPPFSLWRNFYDVLHSLLLSTSTQWAWATAPFVKAGQAGAMSSPETIERRPLSPWEVGARNLLVGV